MGINIDEIRKMLAQNNAILQQRNEEMLNALVERRKARFRSIELARLEELKQAEYEASLKFW